MAKRVSKIAKKAMKSGGLSYAKMGNIIRYKLAKQGILHKEERKRRRKERKKEKKVSYHQLQKQKKHDEDNLQQTIAELHPLSAELTGKDMMDMLDEEELAQLIVDSRAKKRKEGVRGEDVNDDREADYEQSTRSFNDVDGQPHNKKARQLLPIKVGSDVITRSEELAEDPEDQDSGVAEDADEEDEDEDDYDEKEEDEKPKTFIDLMVERKKKLHTKKIQIGCLSANIIEDPYGRAGHLGSLVALVQEEDVDVAITIQKLSALSLLEVFHNIIPAYNIVAHDLTQKLKKETRLLYCFENEILHQYKAFLLALEGHINRYKKQQNNKQFKQVALISIRCLGELLLKHSHFNYNVNIIQAVVPYVTFVDEEIRASVYEFLSRALREDKVGIVSMEIVRKLDTLIRKSRFRVFPDTLRVLLSLRLKHINNLDADKDNILKAKRKLTRNEKLVRRIAEKYKQKPSRQQAKDKRKMAKLTAEMTVFTKEKKKTEDQQQNSDILQVVFGLYIHILKRLPNNKLIPIVLEGLAKFSHLINVEFFSDLLAVLGKFLDGDAKDLGVNLSQRECLHCIQTVFTILSGQGEALTIDPHRFTAHLYSNLFNISAAANHDDLLSAVASCRSLLLQRRKRVSLPCVAAFTKRLTTHSLTLQHHGAVTSLVLARSLLLTHPSTEALLDPSPEGTSGTFDPELPDPNHCNAAASALWELYTNKRHYHPTVRQLSGNLLHGVALQGEHKLQFAFTKQTSDELYNQFDPSEMKLRPALPNPDSHLKNKQNQAMKHNRKPFEIEAWLESELNKETNEQCCTLKNNNDFYSGILINKDLSSIHERILNDDNNEDIDISNQLIKLK